MELNNKEQQATPFLYLLTTPSYFGEASILATFARFDRANALALVMVLVFANVTLKGDN